eukprot:jgi/Chlat1/2/ChrspC201577S00725
MCKLDTLVTLDLRLPNQSHHPSRRALAALEHGAIEGHGSSLRRCVCVLHVRVRACRCMSL